MSLAKKEEVCSHRLLPQLGEPAVGVPIKKRPVLSSDRSVASSMPLSIKPPPVKDLPVSATGAAGCGNESLFNIAKSDTNVITKGKGITDTQIQDHAKRSFTTLSTTSGQEGLFNASSEIPSAESVTRRFPPADESQHQKFLALDLQLTSRQNGKDRNYGSIVKEEKVDQALSGLSSAEAHNNAHVASEINVSSYSNSSDGILPNLDLNVPLDPADSLEGLPAMHESGSGLFHNGTIQRQKAQVAPAAAISTTSNGVGRNIGSTVNISNSFGLSHKCGPADVTLDLQLKPPTRPELGINWKGLVPAPELSLSLFGKPMDERKSLGAPNALFDSGTVGSSKKSSEETASTPGSDKVLVEKIVTPGPCNANPQDSISATVSGIDQMASHISATVSGIDQMASHNLVKKEPEETPQQRILKGAEKARLLEQQSVGSVSNCAESEMTGSPPVVPSRTGFDLNSEIFPNNSIHDGLDVVTENVPIPDESLPDITQGKIMPTVPEVEINVKREESNDPVVAPVSGHSVSLMEAKSLPSQSTVASPAVGLCESSSQPSISTVCKPPARHVPAHADMTQRPCAANEACGALQGSSNPRAKSLLPNSRDNATIDGMSQGSAEMDCSDDEGNTVSRFPTTNKAHGESLGNGLATKEDNSNANNLCKELKKEQDSEMHEDCSSVTNKVNAQGVDSDKRIKTSSVVSHAGEQGHPNEVSVSEKSKDNPSLKSDKNSPLTKTDNTVDDVKAATGSGSTDLQSSSALQKSAAPKLQPTRQSPKASDMCLEKDTSSDIKSEMSPHGKQAAGCNENHVKIAAVKMEHQTENEEFARHSDLQQKDSVLDKDSEVDGASSSQPHSECTKDKSAFEKSEHDKFKTDLCKTTPLQNERDRQLIGSHWRDLGHAYVNRNERWERFMESEREKNNGEWHAGRQRGAWRGAGPHGHPRNFRGPRMRNEFADEPIGGRRRSFEDETGHVHRVPHRRRHSPPDHLMREVDIHDFHGREISDYRLLAHGQLEDLPDDMMEDRFFIPRSHRHRGQGEHGFIQSDRSHSPEQRRGGHVRFHRGRSPEAMPRSPPLMRNERPYLSHCRHSQGHDKRGGMQRNARRCGMEGEAFEPPLHPADLAELQAEEELTGRRKYRERRTYLRSSVSDDDEMLSYHTEDDMEFAEASAGPQEHDSRFRRMGHNRAREEQEDGYRHRGHQGWRDGDSIDNRTKRRRY